MEFINSVSEKESDEYLPEWAWLVPSSATPLFITALGDWIFGNPDGSLSALSVLEGIYEPIANNSDEYNQLKRSEEWLDEMFLSGWYAIGVENGVIPADGECIGWKIHPIIGGEFSIDNLQIFDMKAYQTLMSQLHGRIQDFSVTTS